MTELIIMLAVFVPLADLENMLTLDLSITREVAVAYTLSSYDRDELMHLVKMLEDKVDG